MRACACFLQHLCSCRPLVSVLLPAQTTRSAGTTSVTQCTRSFICWENAIPWRHIQQINLKKAISRWNTLQGGCFGANHSYCLI
jgi:hypothetical protein